MIYNKFDQSCIAIVESNKDAQSMFSRFLKVQKIADVVYQNMCGDMEPQNLYACFMQFERGKIGLVKEANCWRTAVDIYEMLTANDFYDSTQEVEKLGIELEELSAAYLDALEIEN
jgi:hypothetical protein